MNPRALEKLWLKSKGRVPHLAPELFEQLVALADRFYQATARYWGIVDSRHRFQGRSVIHCFNFGTTSVKFPWNAEAVNFGHRLPIRITGSGTIRTHKTYRTLLHQIDTAFLVFAFEESSMAEERIQTGCIIAEAGSGELVRECEVVVPPGEKAPESGGVLYYHLLKRMAFSAEPMDPYVLRGSGEQLDRFRLKLPEPMLMEPGWVLLLLEKDRWTWGVVSRT